MEKKQHNNLCFFSTESELGVLRIYIIFFEDKRQERKTIKTAFTKRDVVGMSYCLLREVIGFIEQLNNQYNGIFF
ncbi:hypothetical protein FWJ33_04500 [Leptospira interrogans serovar Hardjo]|nr:hypothetical protein B0191_12590 [Leptospira interrogans serovar Hardjo]QEI01663.1 hypothetical protein FWJ33_04500 [Leptospira interrogans serovar Hardjo]